MKKASIYLDTTIFSVYHHRSNDVITLANRLKTRDWWEVERQHFDLFASNVVLQELRGGRYPWQRASVRMASPITKLRVTRLAEVLTDTLLERRVVPAEKPGDAIQMAIAAVHEIDYLLTWNYSHLANPDAQRKLEVVLNEIHLRPPLMVSPDTIPQVRFGRDPRRR